MKRLFLGAWIALLSNCLSVQAQRPGEYTDLHKLVAVYRQLDQLYVDSVDMHALVESAIQGMLGKLDPHSAYIDKEEMNQVKANFNGEFSGIGIEFSVTRDTIHVMNLIAGGPAERVGVRANDRIVRIDSIQAVGFKTADVPKYLRGKTGTSVEIEVVRPGWPETLHFRMIRDRIPLNTVDAAYKPTPEIGYIRVNRFGRTTMDEFREGYNRIGRPKSLILDLRGNSGGLMDMATEMAGFFLPKKTAIVSTEGRAVESHTIYTTETGEARKCNLVILIDESSASASEIVSGAIQDWDRGVIIGRPSFGKGLVQRQMGLPDGSAVRITIARYHTPSGRVIQRPYKNGDKKGYYMDHLRRYDDAVRDSIDANAPAYKTLKNGRTVYGGGGIRPDILTPIDTAGYTEYHAQLIRQGVLHDEIVATLDRDRETLTARYADFDTFDQQYEVPNDLLDELAALGEERGIANDQKALEISAPLLRIQIKALLAQRLFGTEAYYRIMNRLHDESFQSALNVLQNWKELGKPLLGE